MEFINTKQSDNFNSSSAKKAEKVNIHSAGWEGFSMTEDPMANLGEIAPQKKHGAMKK